MLILSGETDENNGGKCASLAARSLLTLLQAMIDDSFLFVGPIARCLRFALSLVAVGRTAGQTFPGSTTDIQPMRVESESKTTRLKRILGRKSSFLLHFLLMYVHITYASYYSSSCDPWPSSSVSSLSRPGCSSTEPAA